MRPPGGHELPPRPHLFKVGRQGTGENWAEKTCCEIAGAMGLPHASYHLAVYKGQIGVLSEQFYPDEFRFLPSNLFLSKVLNGYDGSLRFRQREYQLSTILNLVPLIAKGPPSGWELHSALDVFIGYLVLDALVGNTDRHHENWGVVLTLNGRQVSATLAPTFDHASSLGRNESDERRLQRLATRDRRSNVEAYAARARSAFYGGDNPPRTLTIRQMLDQLTRLRPHHTSFWGQRALAITPDYFAGIFANIPAQCISPAAVEFAQRLLLANQGMIREVVLGR